MLVVHPFADKTTPASFERVWKVEAGKTKLGVDVAADAEKPRWKRVEVEVAAFVGQEVTVRLEAHASGWNWEFAYWHGILVE